MEDEYTGLLNLMASAAGIVGEARSSGAFCRYYRDVVHSIREGAGPSPRCRVVNRGGDGRDAEVDVPVQPPSDEGLAGPLATLYGEEEESARERLARVLDSVVYWRSRMFPAADPSDG